MYYQKDIYCSQPHPDFFYKSYSFNRDNIRTINDFFDKIFHFYSKITPVRVDFYLQKEYIHEYDYEDIRRLFNNLKNNMRNNGLFRHCISYLSRLEFAYETGWHFHVLFVFNGQQVQEDYAYAHDICRYWEQVITKGQGRAYSRNMDDEFVCAITFDEQHQALGGYIDHRDTMRIQALIQSSYYLAKQTAMDIEAKRRAAPHARFFNAGQIQLAGSKKRGRPRGNVLNAENPELSRMMAGLNINKY